MGNGGDDAGDNEEVVVHKRKLTVIAVLALAACAEDPGGTIHRVDDPTITDVTTVLSGDEIVAGAAVSVECIANKSDGATEKLEGAGISVTVTPSEGVELTGPQIVGRAAGRYEVACVVADYEVTPASLVVIPSDAVRVVATLSATTAQAGFPVDVTCELEDTEGNRTATTDAQVRASPSRSVTVQSQRLFAENVGTYEVECRLGMLDRVTAELAVVPADPARLVVEATPRSAVAGERVEVSCFAVDAYANPVTVTANVNVTPAPDTQDATGFVATVAQDYDVTCTLPAHGVTSDVLVVGVRPADPATVQIVALDPTKPIYASGDIVEPELTAADIYGNAIENVAVTFYGIPAGSVNDLGTRASLVGDGMITLVATVDPPTHMGATVEDTMMLVVDGLPPQITFTFPARGAMVQADPTDTLTLQGNVTDLVSSVTDFLVNGQPVTPNAQGDFSVPMDPSWGINVIEATAVDEAGNVRELAQSFEIASSYKRASPSRQLSGRVNDGIIAHLGQAALDDNANDVDDLATIARLAIQNLDVASIIPDPATTYNSSCLFLSGRLRLYVDAVNFGTPTINITTRNGGLYLYASIPNVVVNMHTSGDVCDINVNVSGTATAQRIVVSGNLNISRSGNSSVVSMPSANVNIVGLNINLNLPSIIDWAIDGIINLFRGAISSRLETAFRDIIRAEIPPVVEDFLDSLDLSTGFNLPAPLSTRLELRSGLGMVQFDTAGGNIGMDTTLFATPAFSPEPRGGILQEVQNLPSFSSSDPLAVALGYDLLNQAMYSAWYGGAFHIDLAQFFNGQVNNNGSMVNIEATADPMLPPVVRPTGNAQWPVEIAIGDLGIDLDVSGIPNFPMIEARVFAHAKIRANISVDAQGVLQFTLAPNPEIVLDVESSLDTLLDPVALRDTLYAIINGFVPQIVADVIAGIPLPTFDLSSMAGGYLPPNIVLGLGNAQTRFHSSYLILEGNLVQVP